MTTAARLTLSADRWTPFVRTMAFEGDDLTGADFRMQVRLYPNAPGEPEVDLLTVSTLAAEGIKLVGVTGTGDAAVSTISIRINETTIEGLPFPGEPGTDTTLSWDLIVTPAGGLKERWLFGDFIVQAGVTQ